MIRYVKNLFKTQEVEFSCAEEDWDVIPKPYPARHFLPEWYKKLSPRIDKKEKLTNSTIFRCAPFMDAMISGWIIPLAADVEIITNSDASGVEYKWLFNKPMIESHSRQQIDPKDGPPHPSSPKPPLKFLNYWFIKMPPGYSALFVPPLNRTEPRFECICGLVDDTYMGNGAMEYINFPFVFKIPNYTGLIKAGTPLVQVIPIKREILKTTKRANVTKASKTDWDLVKLTRARRQSHESLYRDSLWERK